MKTEILDSEDLREQTSRPWKGPQGGRQRGPNMRCLQLPYISCMMIGSQHPCITIPILDPM